MKAAAVIAAVIALVCLAPLAHAGPDGAIPAPGLCDYPGVGGSGQVMNVYTYWCDFPTEINGSHWHCELGGADLQAAVTAGLSISFFSLSGTLSGQVGAITGSCSWRCPDMSIAATPNPPGAWKDYITPSKCKPVAPAPPPPPPPDPPPNPAPWLPPPPPPMPAVTNPDNPNPDATVNPR